MAAVASTSYCFGSGTSLWQIVQSLRPSSVICGCFSGTAATPLAIVLVVKAGGGFWQADTSSAIAKSPAIVAPAEQGRIIERSLSVTARHHRVAHLLRADYTSTSRQPKPAHTRGGTPLAVPRYCDLRAYRQSRSLQHAPPQRWRGAASQGHPLGPHPLPRNAEWGGRRRDPGRRQWQSTSPTAHARHRPDGRTPRGSGA